MAAKLEVCLAGQAILVDIVDVDTNAELEARFGWDVPLLFAGNNEIFRHVLNPVALDGWLQAR